MTVSNGHWSFMLTIYVAIVFFISCHALPKPQERVEKPLYYGASMDNSTGNEHITHDPPERKVEKDLEIYNGPNKDCVCDNQTKKRSHSETAENLQDSKVSKVLYTPDSHQTNSVILTHEPPSAKRDDPSVDAIRDNNPVYNQRGSSYDARDTENNPEMMLPSSQSTLIAADRKGPSEYFPKQMVGENISTGWGLDAAGGYHPMDTGSNSGMHSEGRAASASDSSYPYEIEPSPHSQGLSTAGLGDISRQKQYNPTHSGPASGPHSQKLNRRDPGSTGVTMQKSNPTYLGPAGGSDSQEYSHPVLIPNSVLIQGFNPAYSGSTSGGDLQEPRTPVQGPDGVTGQKGFIPTYPGSPSGPPDSFGLHSEGPGDFSAQRGYSPPYSQEPSHLSPYPESISIQGSTSRYPGSTSGPDSLGPSLPGPGDIPMQRVYNPTESGPMSGTHSREPSRPDPSRTEITMHVPNPAYSIPTSDRDLQEPSTLIPGPGRVLDQKAFIPTYPGPPSGPPDSFGLNTEGPGDFSVQRGYRPPYSQEPSHLYPYPENVTTQGSTSRYPGSTSSPDSLGPSLPGPGDIPMQRVYNPADSGPMIGPHSQEPSRPGPGSTEGTMHVPNTAYSVPTSDRDSQEPSTLIPGPGRVIDQKAFNPTYPGSPSGPPNSFGLNTEGPGDFSVQRGYSPPYSQEPGILSPYPESVSMHGSTPRYPVSTSAPDSLSPSLPGSGDIPMQTVYNPTDSGPMIGPHSQELRRPGADSIEITMHVPNPTYSVPTSDRDLKEPGTLIPGPGRVMDQKGFTPTYPGSPSGPPDSFGLNSEGPGDFSAQRGYSPPYSQEPSHLSPYPESVSIQGSTSRYPGSTSGPNSLSPSLQGPGDVPMQRVYNRTDSRPMIGPHSQEPRRPGADSLEITMHVPNPAYSVPTSDRDLEEPSSFIPVPGTVIDQKAFTPTYPRSPSGPPDSFGLNTKNPAYFSAQRGYSPPYSQEPTHLSPYPESVSMHGFTSTYPDSTSGPDSLGPSLTGPGDIPMQRVYNPTESGPMSGPHSREPSRPGPSRTEVKMHVPNPAYSIPTSDRDLQEPSTLIPGPGRVIDQKAFIPTYPGPHSGPPDSFGLNTEGPGDFSVQRGYSPPYSQEPGILSPYPESVSMHGSTTRYPDSTSGRDSRGPSLPGPGDIPMQRVHNPTDSGPMIGPHTQEPSRSGPGSTEVTVHVPNPAYSVPTSDRDLKEPSTLIPGPGRIINQKAFIPTYPRSPSGPPDSFGLNTKDPAYFSAQRGYSPSYSQEPTHLGPYPESVLMQGSTSRYPGSTSGPDSLGPSLTGPGDIPMQRVDSPTESGPMSGPHSREPSRPGPSRTEVKMHVPNPAYSIPTSDRDLQEPSTLIPGPGRVIDQNAFNPTYPGSPSGPPDSFGLNTEAPADFSVQRGYSPPYSQEPGILSPYPESISMHGSTSRYPGSTSGRDSRGPTLPGPGDIPMQRVYNPTDSGPIGPHTQEPSRSGPGSTGVTVHVPNPAYPVPTSDRDLKEPSTLIPGPGRIINQKAFIPTYPRSPSGPPGSFGLNTKDPAYFSAQRGYSPPYSQEPTHLSPYPESVSMHGFTSTYPDSTNGPDSLGSTLPGPGDIPMQRVDNPTDSGPMTGPHSHEPSRPGPGPTDVVMHLPSPAYSVPTSDRNSQEPSTLILRLERVIDQEGLSPKYLNSPNSPDSFGFSNEGPGDVSIQREYSGTNLQYKGSTSDSKLQQPRVPEFSLTSDLGPSGSIPLPLGTSSSGSANPAVFPGSGYVPFPSSLSTNTGFVPLLVNERERYNVLNEQISLLHDKCLPITNILFQTLNAAVQNLVSESPARTWYPAIDSRQSSEIRSANFYETPAVLGTNVKSKPDVSPIFLGTPNCPTNIPHVILSDAVTRAINCLLWHRDWTTRQLMTISREGLNKHTTDLTSGRSLEALLQRCLLSLKHEILKNIDGHQRTGYRHAAESLTRSPVVIATAVSSKASREFPISAKRVKGMIPVINS